MKFHLDGLLHLWQCKRSKFIKSSKLSADKHTAWHIRMDSYCSWPLQPPIGENRSVHGESACVLIWIFAKLQFRRLLLVPQLIDYLCVTFGLVCVPGQCSIYMINLRTDANAWPWMLIPYRHCLSWSTKCQTDLWELSCYIWWSYFLSLIPTHLVPLRLKHPACSWLKGIASHADKDDAPSFFDERAWVAFIEDNKIVAGQSRDGSQLWRCLWEIVEVAMRGTVWLSRDSSFVFWTQTLIDRVSAIDAPIWLRTEVVLLGLWTGQPREGVAAQGCV